MFMNLDSEEKFIQLMTLENASFKRFVKSFKRFWLIFGNTEKVYFLPNKQNMYVFLSNSVLSVLISDV